MMCLALRIWHSAEIYFLHEHAFEGLVLMRTYYNRRGSSSVLLGLNA